ncbi:MAG: toxin-antitoxin system HicB family antitoxin [Anaerolineae bacterium]
MSRLTVRLPETLHSQLTTLADREGISLNQFIVYALTRQVTLAYTAQAVPAEAVAQQRASFTALLQSLGQATFDEIEAAMAEREEVEPEVGLTPEVTRRLRERLAHKQLPA